MKRMTKAVGALATGVGLWASAAWGNAADLTITETHEPSTLVDDFVQALSDYGAGKAVKAETPEPVRVWMNGLAERGIDPEFIQRRLDNVQGNKAKFLAGFKTITLEHVTAPKRTSDAELEPVALHAFRFDVLEDYDDWFNDNVYLYFITTHNELVWGQVTSIYKNLNEGTSTFLSAKDRAVFGPTGEMVVPKHHLIVDVGIVESDGDDVEQLQKLSDVIVDLALVALTVYNPQAGVAAVKARAETKNLLRLVIAMNQDDRLAADSFYFGEAEIAKRFEGSRTVSEFSRRYTRETFWTAFDYRLQFRFLK